MTPQEFERAGIKLWGSRWKSRMARTLKRDPSMIWRYVTGANKIPTVVALAVKSLLQGQKK